jgi:hypothetical protein
MSESKQQYIFSHQEVVEALLQKQDIHEGIWALYVEFGIAAANIQNPTTNEVTPAAIVPLVKLGLQKANAISPIAVDAALVNLPKK